MPLFYHRSSHKSGMAPGSAVYVGERKTERVKITLLEYDENTCEERELSNIEECREGLNPEKMTWVDIQGLDQTDIIETAGEVFQIHPLIVEDILHTGQRSKLEVMDDMLSVFVKLVCLNTDESEDGICAEQISIVLRGKLVVTFRETDHPIFQPVIERIKHTHWRLRKLSGDYLTYALMDAVIDSYFGVMEKLGDQIEDEDEALLNNPAPEILHRLHVLKREVLFFRKSIWPLRDTINALLRGDAPMMGESVRLYLRDLHDHITEALETIDNFRELLAGMLETYHSVIGNRTNDVMRVLTIIATIFIPLTFLVGVYGTNFDVMPELRWKWAYVALWGIMLVCALGMLAYFKRKKWF
ncbi:MAG: magnesium/cobalt transporter CorA [Calditrichota bacterium]